ncbi:MAG: DUF2478 domain-containing protein [Myxococcaceae bacterium]|nr:DUF2478 domain-containing protein [Myxococcaceae bacterium]
MPRWAVITFGRNVDRAGATLAVVHQLYGHGVAVAGFLQVKQPGAAPETVELVRLAAEGRALLGVRTEGRQRGASCSFSFDAHAFATCRSWLEADAPSADVLLLHELSKLEVEGQGHAPALTWALGLPGDRPVVFCARAEHLGQLVERFALTSEPVAYLEHHAPGADSTRFAADLAAAVGLGACGHE